LNAEVLHLHGIIYGAKGSGGLKFCFRALFLRRLVCGRRGLDRARLRQQIVTATGQNMTSLQQRSYPISNTINVFFIIRSYIHYNFHRLARLSACLLRTLERIA
jgi:hypothetical protein